MRRSRSLVSSSWLAFLALLLFINKLDTVVVLAEQHPTIPRSNNRYTHYQRSSSIDGEISPSSSSPELMLNVESTTTFYPPWNPSSKIDSDGFLCDVYSRCPGEWELHANIGGMHGHPTTPSSFAFLKFSRRDNKLLTIPVMVRQVPGDGNCLFHSIAACLYRAVNGTHLPMNSYDRVGRLRYTSLQLRNAAVDVLQGKQSIGFGGIRGGRRLFLQGDEYLEASELLSAAAAQFDLTGDEYCDLMRQESYWGGGPEIVALCNYLQRPIHIYELIPSDESTLHQLIDDKSNSINIMLSNNNNNNTAIKINKQFALRRMACFGSPKFDRREPLHILSADSRFPDVDAHRIRRVGNHFLALFPVDTCTSNVVDGTSAAATQGFMRHALIGRGGFRKCE